MELEFYQELLFTAVFSVLFAFLIGKISGGGPGNVECHEDALASADLPDSGEKLWKPAEEELEAVFDGFRTGEELVGSEREIAGVEGDSTERLDEAQSSGMEMSDVTDEVGQEEEIAKEMPEEVDIERDSAEDFKEEEAKGEDLEADLSSPEVKIVRGEGTEIDSGRGEEGNIKNTWGSLFHEDDWVGIERSDLEKLFGVAAEYSVSSSGADALARMSSDVQMELYGLHKVATEGPCYESQPLSLKVSARARWHAWQKLGSMTPEIAMEQYISLLSKRIPEWIVENCGENAELNRADDPPEKERLNTGHPDLDSSLQNQLSTGIQRKLAGHTSLEVESASGGLKVLAQGLTGTFLLNLLFPTRGGRS